MKPPYPPLQRFMKFIAIDDNGCWVWQGCLDKKGYGKFMIVKKDGPTSAHRASWFLHKGKIKNGMSVCHHCDNPPCVNPEHLFIGTRSENMRDASKKGRLHGPGLQGRQIHTAKLNEETVLKIRSEYAPTHGIYRELGRRYGVTNVNIKAIIDRKTWKYI